MDRWYAGAVVSAAMPSRGEIVAGKYRIEGQLGEGGMGVIYAATHLVTSKPVAIKWLPADKRSDERRARLLVEAQAAGRVDHPNVVDVYDFGEHEGAVFLVMERLNGMPLTAALAPGPMTMHDAIRLMMPILRGVAAAHAQGVIHRDLKPDNVFLCENQDGSASTVKVLDFGISKMAGPDSLSLTATGVVMGTPLYCSPEQMKGVKDVDGRADLYALGCLLYEMLEGEPPFIADSYAELAVVKLSERPRPFAQPVPRAVQEIVFKAFDVRRERRYPDVAAFGEALEPYSGGIRFRDTETDWSGVFPARSEPKPTIQVPVPRAARTAGTSRALLLTAAVLACAVAAAAVFVMMRRAAPVPVATPLESASPATIAPGEPVPGEPVPGEPVPGEPVPGTSAGAEPTAVEPAARPSLVAQPHPTAGSHGAETAETEVLDDNAVSSAAVDTTETTRSANAMRRRGMRMSASMTHRTGGLSLGDFD